MFHKCRKAANIRHHDGDLTKVTAKFESLGSLENFVDDIVGQVAAKGGANKLLSSLKLFTVKLFSVMPALTFDTCGNSGLQQDGIERL